MSFAKIFESEKIGQILVKTEAGDDGMPEVRYYFQPEDLGVCSAAISFPDSDAGWELAEATFNASDMEKSEHFILSAMPPELAAELKISSMK